MTFDHQKRESDSVCRGATASAAVRTSEVPSKAVPPAEEGLSCHLCPFLAELVAELRLLCQSVNEALRPIDKYDGPLIREQAAAYLNVHPDTLYRWAVEEGRIAYSRFGEGARAPLRFYRKDLDDFARSCRIPTVDEVRARRVS